MRVAPNSLTSDKPVALGFQIKSEFRNVTSRETSQNKERTNDKLDSCDVGYGKQPQDTLVGGKCSHYCATPVSPLCHLSSPNYKIVKFERKQYKKYSEKLKFKPKVASQQGILRGE